MVSNDFLIVINGQEFRVEGSVLRPASENSFQQEVLKRLDGIESRLGNVESRLVVVEQEQRLLHVKVDDLQTSVYWSFAAIGIFLAALGLLIAAVPILSAFRKSEPQHSESQNVMNSLADAFVRFLDAGRKDAQ